MGAKERMFGDIVDPSVFTPTLLNNQPVPVIMTVTVQFTLK